MVLCFENPCFSAFHRCRLALTRNFTGDSSNVSAYATREREQDRNRFERFEAITTALANGAPMSENPQTESRRARAEAQDELHISRTMAETRRSLQAMIEEEQAAKAQQNATVPPKRAGSAWSVTERLTRRFGLGGDANRRRRFYAKLEHLVETHGDQVLTIISDCVWAAERARNRDRYFCKAVTLRLKEAGFGIEETNHNW